jgi:hypothetical protein
MTAALESATEGEADNMDFSKLYEELEALERRVIVRIQHIQQIRLETGEGAYQPKEQLEEVGVEPTQEKVTESNLSEEEAKQHLSDETTELESAARWQDKAIGDGEKIKGDQYDLPIEKEKMQHKILHKENQPFKQLDRVIEEIRELMVMSIVEAAKRRK